MNIDIQNPAVSISFTGSFSQLKAHALHVIKRFPKEYSLVKESDDEMLILNIPLTPAGMAIGKDQIIKLSKSDVGPSFTALITNENGAIGSYSELQRDKESLTVFVTLVYQAIKGKLDQTVSDIKRRKTDSTAAIFQLIRVIIAAALIFMAIKALTH